MGKFSEQSTIYKFLINSTRKNKLSVYLSLLGNVNLCHRAETGLFITDFFVKITNGRQIVHMESPIMSVAM